MGANDRVVETGRPLLWRNAPIPVNAPGWCRLAGCKVRELPPTHGGPTHAAMAGVALSITRHGVQDFTLVVRVEGVGQRFRKEISVDHYGKMDWKTPEGFRPVPRERPAGRLVVFQAPPGEYRIVSWWGLSEIRVPQLNHTDQQIKDLIGLQDGPRHEEVWLRDYNPATFGDKI